MKSHHTSLLSSTLLAAVLALGVLPATSAHAQEPLKKEISEPVANEFGKIQALNENKDYAGAVKLLDNLIATVANPSFDLVALSQVKAQILLAQGNFPAAIPPLKLALDLGQRHGFFDQRATLDATYLLSQISYQVASETKDPARQQALYDQAYAYIRRWLELSPKPTSEAHLYAASILYNQALQNSAKPDLAKVRAAKLEIEAGLPLDVKPKDTLLVLLLATTQQLGDQEKAAELLELLVQLQPTSAVYWQQLAACYYALASDAKKPADADRYNLRALLTFERAQAHGLLNSPKENFSVVALYFSLQQFDKAIALLETGLKSGGIENSKRNWDILAASYQQIHDNTKAADTYNRAIAAFPKDGQLEFSLAQLHYSLGQNTGAYTHLERAIAKDGLDKPGQVHLFIAYIAYELQRFDDVLKWTAAAGAFADAKKEDIERLTKAAKDALAEREALKTSKT